MCYECRFIICFRIFSLSWVLYLHWSQAKIGGDTLCNLSLWIPLAYDICNLSSCRHFEKSQFLFFSKSQLVLLEDLIVQRLLMHDIIILLSPLCLDLLTIICNVSLYHNTFDSSFCLWYFEKIIRICPWRQINLPPSYFMKLFGRQICVSFSLLKHLMFCFFSKFLHIFQSRIRKKPKRNTLSQPVNKVRTSLFLSL